MASSSRGILIAGVTNRARTQMAEAILRRMSANSLFIISGGVHHESTVHPLAIKVMRDIDINMNEHSVSSLERARRRRDTYDVYISIDSSYERKLSDKTQRPSGIIRREGMYRTDTDTDDNNNNNNNSEVYYDSLLVPSTPSHWSVAADAADARRRWQLWSPRDPKIFHENSTRKFQDHIYEGEPLFMQLRTCVMRAGMKISERWEMDEIATRYIMERSREHEARFIEAREELLRRCAALLERLEKYYGEKLLLDEKFVKNNVKKKSITS